VSPTLFWSTSNSTSMRPSSLLSLIFAVLLPVQVPCRTTSAPLAIAAGAAALKSPATIRPAIANRTAFRM
jgi:hypothetical protein